MLPTTAHSGKNSQVFVHSTLLIDMQLMIVEELCEDEGWRNIFLIEEAYMLWRALNKESKGQIISKCLFGALNSFTKMNKNNWT